MISNFRNLSNEIYNLGTCIGIYCLDGQVCNNVNVVSHLLSIKWWTILLNELVPRNSQNTAISMNSIHFFDKIKLIKRWSEAESFTIFENHDYIH